MSFVTAAAVAVAGASSDRAGEQAFLVVTTYVDVAVAETVAAGGLPVRTSGRFTLVVAADEPGFSARMRSRGYLLQIGVGGLIGCLSTSYRRK
ncbi:hypothetical protein GCM10007036_43410 [Alsobacter metallidurans]|uniref:Uncharacterized protein n=1 Tax=Alsobacter metallidurans TaxID=340221 RepID=A0A917MJW6_9HYPH|nr:hypothetical protein [Alsobacter metallidurans]GGH31909.1 hypothetical protein GCM10007036_43410 [Alsobacter metallidurans]